MRTSKLAHTVIVLISCAFSIASRAQQDTVSQMLDEVIFTAQRQQQEIFSVPHSTAILTKEHIVRFQPRTAPEAAMMMPGVFVQKTNHGGGSPFIRGLTGNQTLILVDGIRLNNSTFRYGPNQYLNTMDLFTVQRMEVAKGTGSVQYGTDALGGVIQLFTGEPQFAKDRSRWSGQARAKYMSGGMEKTGRAEALYRSKKFAVHTGATYRGFGDLIGGDTTGRQTPSGYTEWAFDTKIKMLLKPNATFTIAHQFLEQRHVPVYHKVSLENFALNKFDPQRRLLDYARLNISSQNKWIRETQITVSFQHTVEGRTSRKNNSSISNLEKDRINTLGFTVNTQSHIARGWTAISGVDAYIDHVNSARWETAGSNAAEKVMRGLYPDKSRYGNYSFYSLHNLALGKWLLEGGVRFNAFSITINDSTLGKVKMDPSAFVYNAAVMYEVSRQQHAFISFSTGFRAPNVDDMGTLGIVDFRYEVPSYGLAPEKSRHIEVGYKVKYNQVSASVAGYYMHLSNLITRQRMEGESLSGYPVYFKENSEKGFIRGWEAEAGYEPVDGLQFKGSIAYAYGHNDSKKEPLRRIPPLFGRAIASYNRKRWSGSVETVYATKQDRLARGDKDDNRIPAGGTPGFNLINLYAGYEWPALHVRAGMQNVANTDYRTHGSGINGVGRSGWLAITWLIN